MKMSDKPHCLLTEDLKNMQTDFFALNVRSCSWQYSVQIFNNDCSPDKDNTYTDRQTTQILLCLWRSKYQKLRFRIIGFYYIFDHPHFNIRNSVIKLR